MNRNYRQNILSGTIILLLLCTLSNVIISDCFAMLPDTEIIETTELTVSEINVIIGEMENKGYEVYKFMTDNDSNFILFREALSPIPTPRVATKTNYSSIALLAVIASATAIVIIVLIKRRQHLLEPVIMSALHSALNYKKTSFSEH